MRRRNFMRYYTKLNCFPYPMLIFPSKCLFSSWHGWRGWENLYEDYNNAHCVTNFDIWKMSFLESNQNYCLEFIYFFQERTKSSLKQINAISLAVTLLSVNVFVNRTQIIQLGINFTSLIWLDLKTYFSPIHSPLNRL